MHGFASGPGSRKAVALAEHFAGRGIEVARLDGRVPSFERWRLSAMIDVIRGAIGDGPDRAVVFGSSLGGLAAARAAEEDARICALVLLAPAFRIADRWPLRIGADAFRAWEETGWIEVHDHAHGAPARMHFDFIRDAREVDSRSGGWPDVRVPTLVVHGARDDVVDPALSRAWAAGKRHVRLVEVDDEHELAASIPIIIARAEEFLAGFLGG
jgi:pimeloyl-ACP methyl ester carboxylesterase